MIPISVCIIAKNETKTMEDFLTRLRAYDWEIIVADTGSTDGTRELAVKYADKVVDFPWIDDFAAARNFSIEQARFDQILVLDCDELLSNIEIDGILTLMRERPNDIGRLTRNNHLDLNKTDSLYPDMVERFFNKNLYHYEYPIHEQLMSTTDSEMLFYDIPLIVEHFGYRLSEEEKIAKTKRNNDLLFQELEKNPQDDYVLFQIGQSFLLIDDFEEALHYYGRAITSPSFNPSLTYSFVMVQAYGECLLQTGRKKEALSLLEVTEFFDESADFHCMLGNIYFANNEPLKAMMEFIKATQSPLSFVNDTKNNIPYYNMGQINEVLGNIDGALTHYKRCQSFPMAVERIYALENPIQAK